MVRRYSTEDKVTFDPPVEKQVLVPWKQLASSPTASENANQKNHKFFDFLDEIPQKRKESFVTFPLEETSPTPQNKESLDEEDIESLEPDVQRARRSREVSPMQEKILLEQRWQNNLIKLDELLSDISAPYKGEFSEELFVHTFKNKEILSLCFKLFDWDAKGSVPQDKIVECSKRTFQEHGGREWVELLEVIAYVICQEKEVTEHCFYLIFNSKKVVEKLYKYLSSVDVDSGNTSRQFIMDLIANLTYARPRKGFSADNLEKLEKMFREALGSKKELTFEDFKKIVHSRNSFFAERVFQIFDRDKSGSVSLSEFLDAMHQFTGKSPNDKIKFLFRVYDLDGDGLIQREELEQVMKACMEENGMRFSHEQIEDLTLALFEDADTEHRGEITYEALKAQLEKHPGLLENLSISIDRWLIPPQPQPKQESFLEKLKNLRPYQLTLPYLKNNYVYLSFLFFFISVNLGLFIQRAVFFHNQGANVFYILARGSGQCLNFNCAFILILILRQSITFLRAHGASSFLPLDQHLYFHKMCGWFIFFHSCLHTLMHLINFPTVIVHDETLNPHGYSAAEWLLTDRPGAFGLVPGWANPTGIILIVVLFIMVICSLPFVRKSGYFEVFYWTHLLYIVFWGLTILHGPNFWKWFVGPAVIFTFEKVYRWLKMRTKHGKTYISSGILLPSKVIHLVIQKPNGFHYHPGDYIFVNIPAIAKYEWHPLTISSAPEQEGALWLHIRAVGEWTNRLYNYFEYQQLQCEKRATTSKLSVQFSDDKNIMVNIEEFDKDSGKPVKSCTDSCAYPERKNGVVNVAYVSENKKNIDSIEGENEGIEDIQTLTDVEIRGNKGFINKKKLVKTKSVPDLDVNMKKRERNMIFRENWRRNSETLVNADFDEAFKMVGNQKMRKIIFATNRSVAMSVRYMRRKPRVVTLDMPEHSEEDSSLEETDEELDEKKHASDDVEAPKATAVRRGSGRIFGGRGIRDTSRSQRRKSKPATEAQKARRISRLKEAEVFGQCTVGKPLVIYVDGPYGAPSSHIFRAQHAVLIGTGIGVTPFASILQSIMQRYLKARQTCPKCDHSWISDIPHSVMNLRKVDFFWINRDQRSFEWFVNLLSQLEIEQAEQGGFLERFLDMHMYITSALQKTDMKAVGLQLALELLHEKEKRDLITGLKTRTNAGRPNWDKVFKQLLNQRKGKITVFYCGPPALGRSLRYKCDEYGFDFRKEIF